MILVAVSAGDVGNMFAKLTNEQRFVVFASMALAGIVMALWLGLLLFGGRFAESIVAGEGPFSYLRSHALRLLVGVPADQQASELLSQITVFLGRLTTVYVFCQCALLFGSLRYPNLFADFFGAKSHPINLAILRIVFFLALLPRPTLKKTLHLLSLPDESRVAPPGLSWMVENLPESPELNTWLYRLFVAACVLGVIGLWTRVACVTATLLTFYLMGITQFFGKIEHQHHLVWVGALLAVSRCADVLSVDAWLSKDREPWLARQPSRVYALPLRFVWLFLGVIYFFPGLWKYVVSGPNWFLSENLQCRMLLRLFVSEDWQPIMRMDRYPLLCKFGGLTTILMEIGFVFLVFVPWGRYVAAIGGLAFHWMVKLFLNISFWPIQVYYVTFFNWHRLIVRVSRWLGNTSEYLSKDLLDDTTRGIRGVFVVGTIVIVGNVLCGFSMLDSWPFGVFPTFARVIGPTFESLSFAPVDQSGKEIVEVEAFFDPDVRENFGVTVNRVGEILAVSTRPHPDRPDRLRAIWTEWHEDHPEIQDVSAVNFYLVKYSTNPDDSRRQIARQLLETLSISR